jgi:HEAT repeat protein
VGLRQITIFITFFGFALFADTTPTNAKNQILFLMQAGHTPQAFEKYKQHRLATGQHDLELLQQMSLILLDQGFRSSDNEIQVLTIFGAGTSYNEKTLYILEQGVRSPQPQIQLISLNMLSRFNNDFADQSIHFAMRSDFLIIRLEAAYHLCEMKSPKAVGQVESLMCKVPEEIHAVFPQLFALIGNDPSIKILRRLLNHPREDVRIEAIQSVAKHQRDDLLPTLRILSSHHHIPQQEACAYALGAMKDEFSIPRLEKLASSNNTNVRLAALKSLYQLGKKEVRAQVEMFAKQNELFAIYMLGEMEGSEDLLAELATSQNIQTRFNAGLALLERQDKRALPVLIELFIKDARDLALTQTTSAGKSLAAWKVVPSAKQNFDENPIAHELSLDIKEALLDKIIDLPENEFFQLADLILSSRQNDLAPIIVDLLKNLQTPEAIALLKKYQQAVGSPLIRNYCNLALFELKEPGPYRDNLREWVTKQQEQELIRFRPFIPWEMRHDDSPYELTPEDTSRLLIEAFEAFAQLQNDTGIDVLLEAMVNGNPKNKYALVGLLMRAAQ